MLCTHCAHQFWQKSHPCTNSMTFLSHLVYFVPGKCSNSDGLRPSTGPCCGSWVCHGLYASVVSWMSWNEAGNDQMTCFGG